MQRSQPPTLTASIIADSGLDSSQQGFCLEPLQAVRLLAPAGSGKTLSLLWRCLTVTRAAKPGENNRFLIFTFTRAARDELRERLRNDPRFRTVAPLVEVTTLNSWGYRRVKARMNNPKLLTGSTDRYWAIMNVLQPIWQEHAALKQTLTDSKRKNHAARQLMDLMDQMKSLGYRHDKHADYPSFENHTFWILKKGMDSHLEALVKALEDMEIVDSTVHSPSLLRQLFDNYFTFWSAATHHLNRSALLTLEDQKYWALIELESAIRENRYTTGMHRYHHVLVDEFQDINTLDLNLLKAVSDVNKAALTIVGDDDQAIYEWRGATPEFILNPDDNIAPSYRTYILEVNYRSPKNLVELSQRLIKHNRRRVDKSVRAATQQNALVEIVRNVNLEDTVEYVKNRVKGMLADQSVNNIAIIGRKRSQIIPYQIVFAGDDIPFYAAEDLQVLLSAAFDQLKGSLVLKAQIDQSPPFGPDPVEGLIKLCDEVKHFPLNKTDRANLKKYLASARPRTLRAALELLYAYDGTIKGLPSEKFYLPIRALFEAKSVADSIRAISVNFDGLQKDYGKSLDDIFYTDPPFLYLSEYAERYGNDFSAFYDDIEKAVATLAKIPPAEDDGATDDTWKRPLHLMTALRAKGKEFDVVIILDCNQGIWPSKLATTEQQLEAERRLFYVAFTRARKHVLLVVDDKILGESVAPSQYLYEMNLPIPKY